MNVFVAKMMDVLDEGTHLARRIRTLPAGARPVIAHQRLAQHRHQRAIARKKRGVVLALVAALHRDVEPGQRFARARYPGDEADRLGPFTAALLDRPADGGFGAGQVDRTGIAAGDVGDGVPIIEHRCRLDDRGGRAIGAGFPGCRIKIAGRMAGCDRAHHRPEIVGTQQQRPRDVIECQFQLHIARLPGAGWHQHGKDRAGMAGFVEVLQVERIVFHLLDRGGIKPCLAILELDHENRRIDRHNSIGALAHARDGKFEPDAELWHPGQCFAQQIDLRQPRLFLPGLDIEMMPPRQFAQDMRCAVGKKRVLAGRIIGTHRSPRQSPGRHSARPGARRNRILAQARAMWRIATSQRR